MATIAEALALALDHHMAGRLAEAETLYARILDAMPDQPDALHLRGMLAAQTGRTEEALALIGAAIRHRPDAHGFHANRAKVLAASGRNDAAAAQLHRALALQPDDADAWVQLAGVSSKRDDDDATIAALSRTVALVPADAEMRGHLALRLYERGRARLEGGQAALALPDLARAAALAPPDAELLFQLANARAMTGDRAGALAVYRRTLALAPDHPGALRNQGVVAGHAGRLDEAIPTLARAHRLTPEDTTLPGLLAARLRERAGLRRTAGRVADALDDLTRAAALDPSHAEVHHDRAAALEDLDRPDEALAARRRSLALDPAFVRGWHDLGHALEGAFRFSEAMAAYRRVLRIAPDVAETHVGLASVLFHRTDVEGALDHLRTARRLRPDRRDIHASLMFALAFKEDVDPALIRAEAQDFAARYVTPLNAAPKPHANPRDAERRLRIGYVSAQLYGHATAHFTLPVVTHHDRARFAVHLYANSPLRDPWTAEFEASAERFTHVQDLDDETLAERIRADGIDILMDCIGHQTGDRLLVFARRPAPVQVSYPMYYETSGLPEIDYRITDPIFNPPGSEAFYTEHLVRLPEIYGCYRPRPGPAEPAEEPPVDRTGVLTFASFNNLAKVGPTTRAAWARILRAVPDSRLLLKWRGLGDADIADALRAEFAAAGVDPARLHLTGWAPDGYLPYRDVDIALDPVATSGGTTTCDALWMGVPVVTRHGATPFSRVGYGFLATAGLHDLAAPDVDAYVATAVDLARDRARLREVRRGLRARFAAGPAMDAPRYVRHLEAAYRTMWRRWCAGQPPEPFDVAPIPDPGGR